MNSFFAVVAAMTSKSKTAAALYADRSTRADQPARFSGGRIIDQELMTW
jgi:hypothetical protein